MRICGTFRRNQQLQLPEETIDSQHWCVEAKNENFAVSRQGQFEERPTVRLQNVSTLANETITERKA